MTLVPLGEANGRTRWEIGYDGRRFVVLEHDGSLIVIDALCPHKKGQLLAGLVRGDAIVCPSHWYSFDLRTGACRTSREYSLGRYPVVEQDGALYADLPPRPRRSWAEVLRSHARGGE